MNSGSLIGFFLVFIVAAWLSSAAFAFVHQLLKKRSAAWGSVAEKRMASLALSLPVWLGLMLSGSWALVSFRPSWFGTVDHCMFHGDSHLHLCLLHGHNWSHRTWAWLLFLSMAGILLVRIILVVRKGLRTSRHLAILRSGAKVDAFDGELTSTVWKVDSEQSFCFVAGWYKPAIYVSSGMWEGLSPGEKEAILGHEEAHLKNRDILLSLYHAFVSLFGAPFLAHSMRQRWHQVSEKVCDRLSADRLGDAAPVASALVRIARGQAQGNACHFSADSTEILEERVVAVLQQSATGAKQAQSATGIAAILLAGVGALALGFYEPLHHGLETFLSAI